MTKNILTALCILSLAIMVSINSAAAEESHIVFELAENGQPISFPMTSEEIAAFEADVARLKKIGARVSQTITPRSTIFEMGESGQTILFPIDPEEIAIEEAAKADLSNVPKINTADKKQIVSYELGESGILIEFYRHVSKDLKAILARAE